MANLTLYQVVVLGRDDARKDRIANLLRDRVSDLGLKNEVIRILPESQSNELDSWLPTIAIFLGYEGALDSDHPMISKLLDDSNMIVTVVSSLQRVGKEVPKSLRHINAIEAALPDGNFDRIASLVLEGFRLLRRERRLFISYKRDDSQPVADQLYDALDSRGFDVFIDTRSVPPGVDFQAELWHRLSDSDVVILIDTPGFRLSRWTMEELARANATNIQILHLLWPGQTADAESALNYFHPLSLDDFATKTPAGDPFRLGDPEIARICQHVEQLRARAIAARYRYLVDTFCDAARDRGLLPAVQPQRWISIDLTSGEKLAAVPTIGVPTSDRINAVFDAISAAGGGTGGTWLLYDSRGMLSSWLKHLSWLDNYLPVKSVSMGRAVRALEEVEA